MPAQVLDQQIELYREQAEELWKADHREAMFCCDLEDVISLGLSTLDNIRRRNLAWSESVRAGKRTFEWQDSEKFAEACKLWLHATMQILDAAKECRDEGYDVSGADELSATFRHVSLTSLDVNAIKAAIESLQQGRGIPQAKAMNELRDHLRRKRA